MSGLARSSSQRPYGRAGALRGGEKSGRGAASAREKREGLSAARGREKREGRRERQRKVVGALRAPASKPARLPKTPGGTPGADKRACSLSLAAPLREGLSGTFHHCAVTH